MNNIIIVVKDGMVESVYGSNNLYGTMVEIIDLDTDEGQAYKHRAEAAENSMLKLA
ncbi:MAG: hypothetical protein IJ341_02315 [Bacteroidales bacterium]|nr:hypothetical protein [Bacteroidales bacterium]